MKSIFYIPAVALISILLGFNACEKGEGEILSDQSIYFEYYYINYAWGLQYSHWIIDREGNIRVNQKADSIIWIDENDFEKNLSAFDSVIYQVNLDELHSYINLIPSAAKGKIRCEDKHRADFGGYGFNSYYKDQIILLNSMSDIEDCINRGSAAVKIVGWLESINNIILAEE